MNILAIETGVLPPPDSYLDRDNNIPPEDGDQPPPPPPAEIDLIWNHQGAFWPYVPDAPNSSGGFDSQPPSQPPSPGLSYCTPRTPSSRNRSVTLSHSSGNTGSHCHSSGNTSTRSRTLTEPDPSAFVTEVSQSHPIFTDTGLGLRWKYEVVMADGTTRHHPVSPPTALKLMIPITVADGTIRHHPASPPTVSRVMARRQALESLTPRSTAIPQHEIASYPQEWHGGARSSKYSFIPSYQGWCRGDQLELARPEHAGPSRPTERPLSPVPGHSTQAEPIEQPAFEVPQWSSRIRQQRQRPDNVYGDDPFVDCLTDSQWDIIMAGGIPRPSDPETREKANLLRSYVSCQPVSTQGALESELAKGEIVSATFCSQQPKGAHQP